MWEYFINSDTSSQFVSSKCVYFSKYFSCTVGWIWIRTCKIKIWFLFEECWKKDRQFTCYSNSRLRQWTWRTFRLRNWKFFCRKIMLCPRCLFKATTFPNFVKNSIFLLNFNHNFANISKKFPNKLNFASTRTKN